MTSCFFFEKRNPCNRGVGHLAVSQNGFIKFAQNLKYGFTNVKKKTSPHLQLDKSVFGQSLEKVLVDNLVER